ncbi:MAG: PAS domain-containing sensor histidine kinase, partial [Cytophagaceae bacterium]
LQEPLRKIQQFGDLLKTEHAAALGDELVYLDRMQAAAARMSTLIRDLLSYARISGRAEIREPVSLNQIVARVLLDLELVIEETRAQIQVDHLPTITGDGSQLSQLFGNLLGNALKFRRAGVAPLIEVRAQLVSLIDLPPSVKPIRSADFYHQLTVLDNGIGFEAQYSQRIFEAFQRLHRKHEYAGTGIGLSISERVVISHGGAITASSQPGQGATFTIYLPV